MSSHGFLCTSDPPKICSRMSNRPTRLEGSPGLSGTTAIIFTERLGLWSSLVKRQVGYWTGRAKPHKPYLGGFLPQTSLSPSQTPHRFLHLSMAKLTLKLPPKISFPIYVLSRNLSFFLAWIPQANTLPSPSPSPTFLPLSGTVISPLHCLLARLPQPPINLQVQPG